MFVKLTGESPPSQLDVIWTLPEWWTASPDLLPIGVETPWECVVDDKEGTFVIKAYVSGEGAPPLLLQADVTVSGSGPE